MQAGLVSQRLSFREIFTSVARMVLCVVMMIDFRAPKSRMKMTLAAA